MADPRRAIPVARLYQRRLPGGRLHLTGKWGLARVLVVPAGTLPDGEPVFTLYVVEPDAPSASPPPSEKKAEPIAGPRERAEQAFRK